MNSKKVAQGAYEYRNPYDHNVSQFEGDMLEGEEKVQEMEILWQVEVEKGKKKNQKWISIVHQEIFKELNLLLGVY